jgi:Fe-S cluster assembly ATP-binding protein
MPLLEIRNLTFRVPDRTILSGLDFAVAEHEIHALIGPNGSGKTTLAFLVMGCEGYRPTTGSIAFAGQSVVDLPIHERVRRGITLAWQEPARFEGIAVRDYLALAGAGIDPRESLARVGLDPELYLDRMADRTLSGGQRKRIELAAVLAQVPRLAILDEPAAGIDLLSLDAVVELIHAFKAQGGSVLLITHQEDVASVADRASELAGGRIVACGPPAEVIARYKRRAPPAHASERGRGWAA